MFFSDGIEVGSDQVVSGVAVLVQEQANLLQGGSPVDEVKKVGLLSGLEFVEIEHVVGRKVAFICERLKDERLGDEQFITNDGDFPPWRAW